MVTGGRGIASMIVLVCVVMPIIDPDSPAPMPTTPRDCCSLRTLLAGRQQSTGRFLLPLKLVPPSREVVPKCSLRHALQACYVSPRDPEEAREREALREPDAFTQREALGGRARGQLFRQDRCQL
jgi:hypothetical protein